MVLNGRPIIVGEPTNLEAIKAADVGQVGLGRIVRKVIPEAGIQ